MPSGCDGLMLKQSRFSYTRCRLCGLQEGRVKGWRIWTEQRKRHMHPVPGMVGRVLLPSRLVYCCSGREGGSSNKLKDTMADLDAILGVEEEEEEEEKKKEEESVLDPDTAEQVKKSAESAGVPDDLTARMTKVVESAVKMADGKAGNEELREDMETLIETLNSLQQTPNEDIKLMKEKVFGTTGFWVTEVVPPTPIPSFQETGRFGDDIQTWITFRGNLRGDTAEVFEAIDAKMAELFGDQYIVFLMEEKDPDNGGDPKTIFKVYPKGVLQEEPAGWEGILFWVLLLLSFGSSLQLGVNANLLNLPKETLNYLSHTENYDADVIPPGLENYDFTQFLSTALPITSGVVAAQLLHEAGHRLYAALKEVSIGPSFFIPNSQLGTLGGVTPLRRPVRDRRALWDFTFSGVALGGAVSLGLLIYGLIAGQDSSLTPQQLVPVPTELLQGSFLLGSLTKLVVGENRELLAQNQILLHPLTVAGWCGLVTTAFNLLPVGRLDGGRLLVSAFGKDCLYATSILIYAGLGLGVLGSSLSLPFGLYVLICQRQFEDKYRDQVTEIDDKRRYITAALIAIALLVLVPIFPLEPDTNIGGMTF